MPGHRQPGCPRLYRMKYVENKVNEDVDRVELTYGRAVHEALFAMEEFAIGPDEALRKTWDPRLSIERFDEALMDLQNAIEKGGILPLLSTIEVEVDLDVMLYEDEDFGPIGIAGRLDGVWINADDMSTLYVGDYKTDRSPPTREKVKNWVQGRHYALLAWRSLDRWFDDPSQVKEVVVLYEAVKWNTVAVSYTWEEIESYAAWAEAVARRILRDKKGKPQLNSNCSWCPVRSTCPEWKNLPKTGVTMIEKIRGASLEDQLEMLEDAMEVRKGLNQVIDDVKEALTERVELEGPYRHEGLGKQWTLEPQYAKDVDVVRLHQVMGDEFYNVISVGIGKLNDWKNRHLDKAGQVDACIEQRPTGKLTLKESKLEGS